MNETTALAQEIADATVRSEVECYARTEWLAPANAAGYPIYSLQQPNDTHMVSDGHGPLVTPDEVAEDLAIVQRAARYIRARGNALPWRMLEVDGRPGWVRFVDKEGRPLRSGR